MTSLVATGNQGCWGDRSSSVAFATSSKLPDSSPVGRYQPSEKPRFPRSLIFLLGLAVCLVAPHFAHGARGAGAPDDHTVLILAPTVSSGQSSAEAVLARNLGFTTEVVAAAGWLAKSSADFSTYRAIILGDPRSVGNPSPLSTAVTNAATWGRVVTGNVLIVGSDPSDHYLGGNPGAGNLIENGITFATAQAGETGAYITLSEYYGGSSCTGSGCPGLTCTGGAPPFTPVPALDVFGTFTVDGTAGNFCYNKVHIVADHPALSDLSDEDLSDWCCSVHEAFDSWPASFQVLAIAEDLNPIFTASDGSTGIPYILARGVAGSGLSLEQPTGRARVGDLHSVRAKLLDETNDQPISGALLRLQVVQGPNQGAAITCAPADCRTDATGRVTFTYRGSMTSDRDSFLVFEDTDADGIADFQEPQVMGSVAWYKRRLAYYALGDSIAAGYGLSLGGKNPCIVCGRSPEAYPYRVARLLRTLPGYSVAFGPKHHLACRGATSLDATPPPPCCNEPSDDRCGGCPVPRHCPSTDPPQRIVHLPEQIAQLREMLENDPDAASPDRVNLVSVTIGANDFDFQSEIMNGENICALPPFYRRWVETNSSLVQSRLLDRLSPLLRDWPNLYVVATDYPNPFNRYSAYARVVQLAAQARTLCGVASLNCRVAPLPAPFGDLCNELFDMCVDELPPNPLCGFITPDSFFARVTRAIAPSRSDLFRPSSLDEAILNASTILMASPTSGARVGLATVYDAFRSHESPAPPCGLFPPDRHKTFIQYPSFNIGALSLLNGARREQLMTLGGDCIHTGPRGVAVYSGESGLTEGVFDVARQILP